MSSRKILHMLVYMFVFRYLSIEMVIVLSLLESLYAGLK